MTSSAEGDYVAGQELGTTAEDVRIGRRHVEQRAAQLGFPDLVDDAALVAAELLANAAQHGAPPVRVAVRRDRGHLLVEVSDGSDVLPQMAAPGRMNMTGRGLTLVGSVCSDWGVRREPTGGKTIWAELSPLRDGTAIADLDLSGIELGDDPEWGSRRPDRHDPERFTVVLGDVPTDLLLDAKAHIDNLVREFTLTTDHDDETAVPSHLARLIETVVNGFSEARTAIKRQAVAAYRSGEPRTRLVLHLPLSAADAGEAYLQALDEADNYARAARLLTLETPPEQRLFRRWYVEAVVRQLREIAKGGPVTPTTPFESRLLGEVRRLSVAHGVTERAARLQQVTAALARARTPEDVASVVLSEAVAALGASGGSLLVPAEDAEHLAVPGAVGYGAHLIDRLRDERLDAELPAATALRTGEPVWLETPQERDREFPALRGFEESTVAMCAVPLTVGARTLGALRFSFSVPQLFDDDERAFIMALAALTGQTLLRTEIYAAERQAALDLQRELLPKELVSAPGWEVAAYYRPAGGQEAGGDFYDTLGVVGDRLVALVGDVMGRGVQAAAVMAQIRSTIRAYALSDPDPKLVFRQVDAFFETLEAGELATVSYLVLDAASGEVEVANAGHLPPLLVRPDASELVEASPGLPFGAGGDDRPTVRVTVPPGGAIVLVTDGLVERRGEDIDVGLRRLLEATRRTSTWTAETLLDHVVRSAPLGRAQDDDVTVLVLYRRDDP